jgi:MFS family permease
VVFIGFLGYSLMITVFTPMILHAHGGMVSATSSTGERTILLGILLCLYPLGQFFGSPVMGALSDRFGRKCVLLTSLCVTTTAYVFLALALSIGSPTLLGVSSLVAGLSEANVVIAQSAIADVTTKASRSRFFGYIYISASLAWATVRRQACGSNPGCLVQLCDSVLGGLRPPGRHHGVDVGRL